MVGQKRLLEQLNNLSLNNFTTPILLFGATGCGKHLLASELATRLNLELIKIEEAISADELLEYQQCPVNKLYLINLSNFTEKQQNQFLKFVEEPGVSNFIILIAESEFGILDTILNRCKKYHFDNYTKAELQEITQLNTENLPENIYNICKTPGQLLNCNIAQLNKLYVYCKNILAKYRAVDLDKLLAISSKINYKENYDKYDFMLFFNTLLQVAYENYMISHNDFELKLYLFIDNYVKKLQTKTIAKENFLINFLFELKQIV